MFVSFGVKDAIDIVLVAFLMYQTYKLMKSSGTLVIFSGVVSIIIVWLLASQVLEMRLIGGILDKFISVGFIVLVILFQDDIRRFLVALGSNKGWRFLYNLFSKKIDSAGEQKYIAPVVLACMNLAKRKAGALIVIQHEMDLSTYAQTGEMFHADVNTRLIENIFFKNSPLHDGAMIIYERQIKAAGCILPVSRNQMISKRLGLRHGAALGITETTDAVAIVVSEETGEISSALNGEISANLKPEQLEHLLSAALSS